MKTWQTEVAGYLGRLRSASEPLNTHPPHPPNIPQGPLVTKPTTLQAVIHRSLGFYVWGVHYRTKESLEALIHLWSAGYLSPGAVLARLLFEIWGASRLMSEALKDFCDSNNLEPLSQTVNKLFEGVRSEVLLPWGRPASEKPIHVLDTIRALKPVCPQAVELYEDLCESAHANQPRFMEWWFLGKLGDNWSNETVQKRGHVLLDKTVSAIELAVYGVAAEVETGLRVCRQMY